MGLSAEQYISRLVEISKKKLECLNGFMEITVMQSKSITEDGIEELHKLIDIKQGIMNEVDKLDDAFSIYFSRLKRELGVESLDELQNFTTPEVKELKEIIPKIVLKVNEIQYSEKKNRNDAQGLLESIGSQIKQINQSKKANSGYKTNMPHSTSIFVDKKQ